MSVVFENTKNLISRNFGYKCVGEFTLIKKMFNLCAIVTRNSLRIS